MEISKHERRQKGLQFLQKHYGRIPKGYISVSRFYHGVPAWGFDLPLAKLQSPQCKTVYFLCKRKSRGGFKILKVPTSYFVKNLCRLSVSKDGRVRLHLSAQPKDFLVDFRGKKGKGHLPFARWLVQH